MHIDENKIRHKSKQLAGNLGGFKGVVPRWGDNPHKTKLDYLRIAIGVGMTLAIAAGTLILFYNLLVAGGDLMKRKSAPQKVEYLQVIFKPKNK